MTSSISIPLSSLFILGTLLSCIISASLYSRDFHPCTTNLTDLNSPVINCNIFQKCNWWTELCFIPNMHSFGEQVTWLFICFFMSSLCRNSRQWFFHSIIAEGHVAEILEDMQHVTITFLLTVYLICLLIVWPDRNRSFHFKSTFCVHTK